MPLLLFLFILKICSYEFGAKLECAGVSSKMRQVVGVTCQFIIHVLSRGREGGREREREAPAASFTCSHSGNGKDVASIDCVFFKVNLHFSS